MHHLLVYVKSSAYVVPHLSSGNSSSSTNYIEIGLAARYRLGIHTCLI